MAPIGARRRLSDDRRAAAGFPVRHHRVVCRMFVGCGLAAVAGTKPDRYANRVAAGVIERHARSDSAARWSGRWRSEQRHDPPELLGPGPGRLVIQWGIREPESAFGYGPWCLGRHPGTDRPVPMVFNDYHTGPNG